MQVFRCWAAAAMAVQPDLDVSTCHNYEISYAFRWACTNLGCLPYALQHDHGA